MQTPDDMSEIDRIIAEKGRKPEAVLPILQAVQAHYKYLPPPALRRICELTEITPAAIEGVASFFSQFRRSPVGKHMISVCDGTACHVKGAEAVYDSLREHLGLAGEADTDAAGLFTVQRVACLGCCTLAPAVQIDTVTYGHLRHDTVAPMIRDFLDHEAKRQAPQTQATAKSGSHQGEIRIGLGSCCVASGSAKIRTALQEGLADLGCDDVQIKPVGCVGMCYATPLVEVVIPGESPQLYSRVKPEDIQGILARHFTPASPFVKIRAAVTRLLETAYTDDSWDIPKRYAIDVRDKPVADFLGQQRRLATESCGRFTPTDLEEYRREDGFAAVAKVHAGIPPETLIAEIQASGLRGRGGAGFPTGRKWQVVREAPGPQKYLICNGDEGDPGAFMDRMILESYPYRVIEGMILAAYAVGATEGILYIRAEYPLAVRRLRETIAACEQAGLLGDNILGHGQKLHLRVFEGAGAFVCGEESALIASIEGRRGMPAYRPPFPAEKGLFGFPTLVNNTETLALLPWIVRNGATAFAALGTDRSKGTKVFSLAGKIRRGGLVEVPMGISLRAIVEDIGGGTLEGRMFKAVQIGGPSGGCIPASLCDLPVDYERLTGVGAMMGSGGLVVLDNTDCMVEMARYFLSFTQNESCGKCTPCRIGTKRMLEILTRLCAGEAKPGDLEKLEHLAKVVARQSLCGLGKTAPNPVLTSLKYFRDEFTAHLESRCPAKRCKKLITYTISDRCIGCCKCQRQCADNAITGDPYQQHRIDPEKCTRCDLCRQVCPVKAITVESGKGAEGVSG